MGKVIYLDREERERRLLRKKGAAISFTEFVRLMELEIVKAFALPLQSIKRKEP